MKGKIYIVILLLLASRAVFGAAPDSAGIFIPDKNVERLAQDYDRISAAPCSEFNMAWPAKVLILKKKGKGIIVQTKIKIYLSHETGRKTGKEEKDADLLFKKLASLERNQLTHCPVPEKWRPARK